ncbi:hypothetical protein JVT61DRAFT_10198 [Boletus reticuloceps]|uniref:E3 ubiquitin-protein ligase listerin n=1 Tax=Boletus reticuloceps TaxID=495285 RepID=A0A8I2YXR3_9AGAM|nr:hypothetical protein JVT61DRAFT_10198 [Boletus reticuloceps]
MAKGQKSSATSGTRKKNARKATQGSVAPQPSPPPKQSRPKGANHKLSKREAREQHKKVYIPPIKPAPPVLDPLDTTGLAHLLPPELVVVLRALGKKDAVTRGKAIEELGKWVEDAIKEQAARDSGHDRYEEESGKTDMIVKMLPVWLHRSLVLFTHPERRLRHLAASLHSTLLRLNEAREALLAWTSEIASQSELETLLGTWAMLSYDVDRGVAMVGMRSWVDFVTTARGQAADKQDEQCTGPQTRRTRSQPKMTLNPRPLISLFRFAQDTVLDPQGLHTALNPAPVLPPAVSPPQQGHKSVPQGKSESVAENDSDRAGRLRVGALGVIRWILGTSDLPLFCSRRDFFSSCPVRFYVYCWFSIDAAYSDNWPEVDSASATDLAVLTALLSSLPFWSTLHPAAVLLRKLPATLIRILSTVVLRSAWVETDIGVRATLGAPLMIFLRDYSQAWTIDMENASKGYDDLDANDKDTESDDSDSNSGAESETDSESEGNGDDDDFTGVSTESPPNGQLLSEAYTEFLQFLELGCSGSPPEGYPLVVVVLAGIPKSILPTTLPPVSPLGPGDKEENEQASNIHPISQLLTSFWAPLDAGLLDRRTVASSWLKAFSECLVLIVRRGVHAENTTHVKDDAKNLLASQFSRLWTELVTKRLRVEETEVAAVIVRTADRIGKIGDDLFDASFDALCQPILDALHTTDGTLDLAPVLFYHFTSTFALGTHAGQKIRGAVEAYMRRVTEVLETVLRSSDQVLIANAAKDPLTALVKLMDTFGPSLFDDQSFTSCTDAIFVAHSLSLVQVSTSGVLAYLGHRSKSSDQSQGQLQTQVFWTELLGTVASSPTKVALSLLSPLVGASLPIHLRGASPTMDDLTARLVSNVIAGVGLGNEEVAVAKILSAPAPFISFGCLATIASMLSNSVATFVNARLRFAGVSESTTGLDGVPDLPEVGPTVGLVRELADSGYEFTGDLGAELYTNVFLVGYAVPYQGEASGDKWLEDAKALWRLWISQEGDRQREMMDIAGSLVKEKLKSVLVDEKAETRSEYIIQCITPSPPGIRIDPLSDILPSHEEFDTMLDSSSLPSSTTSPSLALLDPTLPTSSDTPTPSVISRKYARTVSALLAHLAASRTVARSNLWALRHILVLGFYANEYLRVEDGLAMFDVTRDHLVDILEKVKSLTTYLLGRVEDGMHAKVVNMLMSKDGVAALEDGSLASFVISVTRRAKNTDSVRIRRCSASCCSTCSVMLQRTMPICAPQTTITILSAITAHAPEPPKLDRYRNELAASLTGVHPGAASTTGLIALRLLAATAPDPDSDVVFLPQQRAVNVMKACQAWVAADEDDEDGVDEDVESAMTLVFFYLAPILQNVPGSHWDFIWDVIENNLESCSLEDSATLTTLGRTLRLVIAIDDLALTNKPLRAKWDERKTTVLGLTKDMIAVNTVAMPYSEPRTLCRQLALSVIQDMPSEMMNEKTLPSMCHLLGDQSPEVQRIGYHLLHNAARKRTEHYVIEAGVDTEDMVTSEIPPELLAILQHSLGSREALDLDEQPVPRNKEVSGYLLAWMITFDLFIDASMKVRSGYFNHMRSPRRYLSIFHPQCIRHPWFVQWWKTGIQIGCLGCRRNSSGDCPPYHRALLTVPALIRSWISDCTDKQLLTRVIDYTSSYFSPGIIKAELAQVRQSGASSELSSTENLTVKVSPASGEVTASYTVDEQTLELSIRMPSDWPLHRLEVRDTKMVGVSGDKWRAWILGVQQVVWQQNGRIVDALTLFTKNVTLHFSGQVECAICYSYALVSPPWLVAVA